MIPMEIARRLKRRIAARFAPVERRVHAAGEQARAVARIAGTLLAAAARRCRMALAGRQGRPLRVGVDIRPFYEPLTGVGWYLFHLLEELAGKGDVELVLFGDPVETAEGPRLHAPLPAGADYARFDLRGMQVTSAVRAIARLKFPVLGMLKGCDVFFGANYFLPRALSAIAPRRVVTVHDLTFRRFPELLQNETLANLDREMSREVFRADAVICVSEATRRDLLNFFSLDRARAVTIHSGLAPMAASGGRPAGLPSRYALFVSTIEPRKNLDVLLDAFESVRDGGSWNGSLVIVGKVGWKSERTMARIRASRHRGGIVHLDYISRDQLAAVYASAEMFVFPSIYEGFGFPLLEAMSLGVPSIAARSSSLPEIGGDAALYFDPSSAGELAAAMVRVGSDAALRESLAEKGRARAAEFRWSAAAEATLDVLWRASGLDRGRRLDSLRHTGGDRWRASELDQGGGLDGRRHTGGER